MNRLLTTAALAAAGLLLTSAPANAGEEIPPVAIPTFSDCATGTPGSIEFLAAEGWTYEISEPRNINGPYWNGASGTVTIRDIDRGFHGNIRAINGAEQVLFGFEIPGCDQQDAVQELSAVERTVAKQATTIKTQKRVIATQKKTIKRLRNR